MPLNPDAVLGLQFPLIERKLTDHDCMLYALSVGVASDPLSAEDLKYVYEENLETFPTIGVVLGRPGTWYKDPNLGMTFNMIVHGTQRIEIHRPIPVEDLLVVANRNIEVADKGFDKGALVLTERQIVHASSGDLLARMESGIFCRADGGFDGSSTSSREYVPAPSTKPDISFDWHTAPNQALYYRLCGDRNPLHASPTFAASAGFPRPILHGLCTFGIAAHALMRMTSELPALRVLEVRFSKPVFPGDTLRFDVWNTGLGCYSFRARVEARNEVVLDRGRASFGDGDGFDFT